MYKSKAGFTIIEVLIATFIIGVAMAGLVMGFSNGLAMVEEMREISTADRLIQGTMEELRGGIIDIPGAPDYRRITTIPDKPYTVTTSATSVESTLTKVTVTVNWDSHTGKTISRSLVTYFTENGITHE